jgi:hypothetical protein
MPQLAKGLGGPKYSGPKKIIVSRENNEEDEINHQPSNFQKPIEDMSLIRIDHKPKS